MLSVLGDAEPLTSLLNLCSLLSGAIYSPQGSGSLFPVRLLVLEL